MSSLTYTNITSPNIKNDWTKLTDGIKSDEKKKSLTIDCRLSFNMRLVLASLPLSKLLTSLSKSLIRLKKEEEGNIHQNQIQFIKNEMKEKECYLLQSRILSVSSSSCLLCLLASLIFSSFWNPFLDIPNTKHYRQQQKKTTKIQTSKMEKIAIEILTIKLGKCHWFVLRSQPALR